MKTRAVYVALAIDIEGEKQVLGLWIAPTEGAVSWLTIFGELKARGMEDCFIACVDGLKGLPEAIETLYPRARVQLCIVHQVRKSLRYVPWKERKPVAASLRAVYAAPSEEAALAALEAFERQWSEKYPAIAPLWRKDWERLAPFFDYAPAIRKVVYTTNAIESLNYSLRKIVKGRGAFPNDDAVRKLLYLGLREALSLGRLVAVEGQGVRILRILVIRINKFVCFSYFCAEKLHFPLDILIYRHYISVIQ